MAQGVDLDAEAPAARITEARMRGYVLFLQKGRASVTVATYLGILSMAALAMFPERDWRWLQAAQRQLKMRSTPSRKKADRLVAADELVQLGFDLMQRVEPVLDAAKKKPDTSDRVVVAAARDYRDGLLIAVQASRPLRVKNLLMTELGKHLILGPGQITLQFRASETKGKRALRTTWPEALRQPLQRYLAQVRPILIAAVAPGNVAHHSRLPGAMLWVGQGGGPLTAGGLQRILRRQTEPRFGHSVNAHLFRDAVASTVANQDPNNARLTAQLLGHATLRTTERNYIMADSGPALSRHHDLIAAIRRDHRKRPKRRGLAP